MRPPLASFLALLSLSAPACSPHDTGSTGELPPLTDAELRDPEACRTCHATHVQQWEGSMHAYAGDDPVFVAMNARAQRETGGAVGDFCVKCHAPVALRDGLTTDGTNLASLPRAARGVTCFFCHTAAEVDGSHNNPIALAGDGVLRAAITDPVGGARHRAGYSPLHDRTKPDASRLCGSCHDIVTPQGAHIERTYAEWQASVFSHEKKGFLGCGQCHMAGYDAPVSSVAGSPVRRGHDHGFPGVDTAIVDGWPEKAVQLRAVQQSLDAAVQAALCVRQAPGGADIQVVLDAVGTGHSFPSGASAERRVWVELHAYAGADEVYRSGVVEDGRAVTEALADDADAWLIRDCVFDAGGKKTDLFWQAASWDSNTLPAQSTLDPTDPAFYASHIVRRFPRVARLSKAPDRVTMRVRVRAMDVDLLDQLVASGDLDRRHRDAIPTLTLAGTELEWTQERATIRYDDGGLVDCVSSGLSGARSATPAAERMRCAP